MICECGCGQEVAIYRGIPRRFVSGHNNRGRKHTDITKQKMSKAGLGRKTSNETKRKISEICKGYKHTDEALSRMSGENNPNWQGGISFEPYCHKFNYRFKEMIREKFNRECFLCGKTEEENGRKLDVHHVNYDKSCLCSEIECEFVPLCMSCHNKTSNGDREYYEALILEKLLRTN